MNCLKCGRTVPENTLLCADCLRERAKPTRRQAELTPEKSKEQQIAALRKRCRSLRRALALFVAAALLATAALGGAYVYVRRQRHQIASQTSRINSLQTVISEQEGQLAQANALNNTLRDKIDSDQKTLDAYEILTGLTPDEVNAPVGP
ncbi:MAG: hypothetical protein E7424_01720 [Ruminococcaceae bacterium]|nr:hypothetical protein [Oscillospiraceae bacterium]